MKIDLRVAQIIVAERIPKADKLLRLEVDLGYEQRQILSGIAEWYTPEELIGRQHRRHRQSRPRKMRGLDPTACCSPPAKARTASPPRHLWRRYPARLPAELTNGAASA